MHVKVALKKIRHPGDTDSSTNKSPVNCHMSLKTTATTTDPLLLKTNFENSFFLGHIFSALYPQSSVPILSLSSTDSHLYL